MDRTITDERAAQLQKMLRDWEAGDIESLDFVVADTTLRGGAIPTIKGLLADRELDRSCIAELRAALETVVSVVREARLQLADIPQNARASVLLLALTDPEYCFRDDIRKIHNVRTALPQGL